ncbi:unnamed protein product [Amoebophrya sp. A25]|nr:unnamed protein product [Amoebophrya sp. A25]|eukprot:GSA25T00022134001.1
MLLSAKRKRERSFERLSIKDKGMTDDDDDDEKRKISEITKQLPKEVNLVRTFYLEDASSNKSIMIIDKDDIHTFDYNIKYGVVVSVPVASLAQGLSLLPGSQRSERPNRMINNLGLSILRSELNTIT